MNKKIFTFLLALAASVGMMTAQDPKTIELNRCLLRMSPY